jgi:hypothetical protein
MRLAAIGIKEATRFYYYTSTRTFALTTGAGLVPSEARALAQAGLSVALCGRASPQTLQSR